MFSSVILWVFLVIVILFFKLTQHSRLPPCFAVRVIILPPVLMQCFYQSNG